MQKIILHFLVILISVSSTAQTEGYDYVQKDMLVILSTKNYKEAKKFAEEASKKLSIKLDLRELTPAKQTGLTFNKTTCEDNGWGYPCYVFRGRDDDGEYISIEYSNGFNNFTKGLYIVVAASGDKHYPAGP